VRETTKRNVIERERRRNAKREMCSLLKKDEGEGKRESSSSLRWCDIKAAHVWIQARRLTYANPFLFLVCYFFCLKFFLPKEEAVKGGENEGQVRARGGNGERCMCGGVFIFSGWSRCSVVSEEDGILCHFVCRYVLSTGRMRRVRPQISHKRTLEN